MTIVLTGIALGAILSLLVGIVLFACWLEHFVRMYGDVAGPPWERRQVRG